ncbi:MAG: HIT domain-containing protein [Anaerolineae bacterium]|nr:MAG: HIT domain-containing protein [Anaerolineae bacterium]
MIRILARLLFRLARSRLGRGVVSWGLTHMSFALPVDKLRQTPTLLAFHHPKPAYPLHILIVPRAAIANLSALAPDNTAFLTDLLTTTQSLIAEYDLERRGYRLICNGGPNQDIPHLHFHLIAEK